MRFRVLALTVIFDLVGLVSGNPAWWSVSFWVMAVGLLAALIAAPFALIDFMAFPRGPRARGIGTLLGIRNVVVLLLFLSSWLMREPGAVQPDTGALTLSFGATALTLVTAWLAGGLVSGPQHAAMQ